MSITKRLISGSAATWSQMIINIFTQILFVPIYLSFWDVDSYGVWIAVQALMTLVTTLELGHQDYLGYEFLRLGKSKRKAISFYLWSGIGTGMAMSFLLTIITAVIVYTGFYRVILDGNKLLGTGLLFSGGVVLLANNIAWFLTGSAGGILTRALTAFDYYPRLSWWGVFIIGIKAIAPAIAVMMGAGLLEAGMTLAITTVVSNFLMFIDLHRLIKKERITFKAISLRLAWKNFSKSVTLSFKIILENVRVGGVRIILAPLAGSTGLVSFATIRTGANFAMQGLQTITNPLTPELMKFLRDRDQDRSETAFGTIWVIVIAIMAPAVVILQTFIEPLYIIWTKGKVAFNAELFAILSLSVLVYAISQPAIAIVKGNNLLKTQLYLSSAAAIIVVGGMFLLVPMIGILGAGIVLLASELAVSSGYKIAAESWLKKNGLTWPGRSYAIARIAIWLSALAMVMLIAFPAAKLFILAVSLALMYINITRYWQTLPQFTRQRTRLLISSWPVIGRLIT